ncbi:hypothetical protein MCFN_03305 [Mycoplasmopsis californica]|uniref:YlxR domain-containing protein n=2 Tax=Mycoplasmopsis californica TaxID=2113 RepID=A0A059XMP7_9BACT|nr:YlxR family protein [Mycoplasmopsis californica]AIA29769.1 hypothetical protein MCFN_03305 [Mycoplasmopsis californica]
MVRRKCIVTGLILPLDQLVRVDFDKKNNIISLDLDKIKKGRGCYINLNEQNWELVKKTKALNRSFRTNVTKEVYNQIEEELRGVECLKRIDYQTKKM